MKSMVLRGIVYGILFCIISAAFDVFVSNIIQNINPAIFILYCFILSTLIFIFISGIKTGYRNYLIKAKMNFLNIFQINLSVLLNWGGLILSLKYLEPAVVGIASVACGPALTLIISRYIIKGASSPTKIETYIAWIVLFGVIIMLINSYYGNSGITSTSDYERIIGILCVALSAVGTVFYTFFSKKLSLNNWKSYEVLGLRNVLMLITVLLYGFISNLSFALNAEMLYIVLILSIIGHIFPIFLIQSSIVNLDPIHVSLILLLLPVFTLLFQFADDRVQISYESIGAVIFITVPLALLGINKFKNNKKVIK
ncbi:EamA/RhaT family transporter [Salmonella enterica subsp. diarizonae]|nr:EamA/RhaT family transporter [Salmonella enterica subsp. diarizonae]